MTRPTVQLAASPGTLRFTILGPLALHRDGRALPLGPLKQRVVLAALLGSANSPVSVDALTDAVWPHEPPRTARKNLQVYVSALRALLADNGPHQPRLTHTGGEYLLRVAEDELDHLRFRSLLRAAEGQPPGPAARLLRQALDLWQGPPLGGDLRGSPLLAELAERLELRHVTAYEGWAEAELALGGAAAVVEGLRDLVERHPLRERLRAAWMCALSAAGRQAEALAVYDDYRQLLARELGLEPGGAIAARYRAVLAGDDRAGPTAPPEAGLPPAAPRSAAPTALPPDLVDFAGHGEELSDLCDLLENGRAGAVLLSGPAGAGKTTLAVRAAHLLDDRFPDGRLCVCLRDPAGRARPLATVLAQLARHLGVSNLSGPEAWRDWLAEHRALVVLDDVPEERAVRPLLPFGGKAGRCSPPAANWAAWHPCSGSAYRRWAPRRLSSCSPSS